MVEIGLPRIASFGTIFDDRRTGEGAYRPGNKTGIGRLRSDSDIEPTSK
jgi:hypothetical protein